MNINEIKARIAEFDRYAFGESITEDMFSEAGIEKKVPFFMPMPKVGEHPRVLITRDMTDGVRAALANPEFKEARAEFDSLLAEESDGTLPPATYHETGRRGEHNMDYRLLRAIQAKALLYLLDGDEEVGYKAVLMMLNYMKSLDLKWIHSDQSREFGFMMFSAACVYDWCYPLLDEKTKFIFISAVEHKMLRGTSEDTVHPTCKGVKMEIGFPPTNQGPVSGHGCELQLQRDYLAFSIAIFDELPGWWEFVGRRFYLEYIPTRKIFYEAGVCPQGISNYAQLRFLADLYGAWLIKGMTGKSPYSLDMARVVHSFAASETANNGFFQSGDGNTKTFSSRVSFDAIISAYLHNDPIALSVAKNLGPSYSRFGYGAETLSPAEFFICVSGGVTPLSDYREALDKVLYNGGFIGQLITRSSWSSDAAMTYAKIQPRTGSNHDHQACGHFQIYYKGLLTSDQGIYSGYGTPQWANYHQGTVGHNSILIYNPDRKEDEPIYDERGKLKNSVGYWYCGNQKRPHREAQSYNEWLEGSFERGEIRGVKWGFFEDGDTPKYSYVSGDITKAYTAGDADFVCRSMLTAYTGRADIPMLFFVADRIDVPRDDFKKTFLLQVMKNAPQIEGNTVTLTEGDGRLVLTSLIGNCSITALGGTPETNSMIDGRQLMDKPTDFWGRVEISPKAGNKCDKLLNLIYVTDKDSTASATPKVIDTDGRFVGASACGVAALLSVERLPVFEDVSFSLDEACECFVSGLSAGVWNVYEGDELVTKCRVRTEEGLLTFKSNGGKIRLLLA